jgi:cell shape-determining protein MreD
MTAFRVILLLLVAWLAVFWQAASPVPARWLQTRVDLLPALMVYAALTTGWPAMTLLALFGGLGFDALSANPPGTSVLPLLAVGAAIHARRELILRDQPFAQFVLGCVAGALTPLLAVGVLLSMGRTPLLGWASLWQWFVMALAGGVATPGVFFLFDGCERAFMGRRVSETSFRPDREIRRGRY